MAGSRGLGYAGDRLRGPVIEIRSGDLALAEVSAHVGFICPSVLAMQAYASTIEV